jgi:hypothetical protein
MSLSKTAYLKALRGIASMPSKPLAKASIQSAVVRAALGYVPEREDETEAKYREILEGMGVFLVNTTETGYRPLVGVGATAIPLYETQWRFVQRGSTREEKALMDLLLCIAETLEESGFANLFARVYVSDDVPGLAETLELPMPAAESCTSLVAMPLGSHSLPIPILMVQGPATGMDIPASCLTATLQVLTHYFWGLHSSRERQVDPLTALVDRFMVEVFVQMQCAAILGRTRVIANALCVNVEEGAAPEVANAPRGPRDSIESQGSKAACIFLETFPWFAAREVVGVESSILELLPSLWTDEQHQLAKTLLPFARDLFTQAEPSQEISSAFARAMGSEGPCGPLFERYSVDLLFSAAAVR